MVAGKQRTKNLVQSRLDIYLLDSQPELLICKERNAASRSHATLSRTGRVGPVTGCGLVQSKDEVSTASASGLAGAACAAAVIVEDYLRPNTSIMS